MFCVSAGEHWTSRVTWNQPWGFSHPQERRRVREHLVVTVANQRRCQFTEKLESSTLPTPSSTHPPPPPPRTSCLLWCHKPLVDTWRLDLMMLQLLNLQRLLCAGMYLWKGYKRCADVLLLFLFKSFWCSLLILAAFMSLWCVYKGVNVKVE